MNDYMEGDLEVEMGVVRSAQSLDVLKRSTNQSNGAELTLTSFQLRKDQKVMIEELARRNGESQATVIRAIIDEWVALKMREVGQ